MSKQVRATAAVALTLALGLSLAAPAAAQPTVEVGVLETVGHQQHGRTAAQHAATPAPVELVQRLRDARAAGLILIARHPGDGSGEIRVRPGPNFSRTLQLSDVDEYRNEPQESPSLDAE